MAELDNLLKILIVEDDRTAAHMLQRMLKDFGHSILTVTDSGEEAIVKSGKLKPDMVLMDIGLSGRVDGVSAAEDIYRRYQIPVIYITAGVDQETFQRAKKSMPFGYILKPFNQLILMTTIEMGWYRFQAEMDLRESEKRNEDILATIPDIMFTLKRDGSFLSESEADLAARIWPSGEMRQEAMESIERAIVNNQPETFEYTLQRNPENVHCEARIIRSGSETALVIIRDVTERKKVELELEEYRTNLEKKVADRTRELQKINEQLLREIELRKLSEDKIRIFSQAVNQSPISILICDRAGSIEYANKTALELSGYSEEEVMGQGLMNFAGPQPSSGMSMEQAVGPGPWIGEIVGRKKNGEIFYGLSTVSPILDDEEKITHFVVRVDDITRKKMEQMEIDRVLKRLESSQIEQIDIQLDWREWKEKMMSRNISRTDKSLFRNINNSFTQGAGFGSLISLLEMLSVGMEEKGDRVSVDRGIFNLVKSNLTTAQTAFKTFSNIDWIIQNDFTLEKLSFRELYDFTRAIISKQKDFCAIKQHNIIINDYNAYFDNIHININREFLDKAFSEVLVNALKFSRPRTFVVVLVNVTGANAVITVVNDPIKGEDDILGIPPEYEKLVFEPFFRLSKLVFELYQTLDFGLGLTLVEKIVGKHGGETTARNIIDHSDPKRDPLVKVDITMSFPVIKE